MFPEYRDLISRLKNENPRFMSLFDKHNKLDHEIARKEGSDSRVQCGSGPHEKTKATVKR
ncbi:hypothetical protein BvCmsSINP011_04111 [Escherichia coli]|nr:hypothetical protein BvCmsSINP011_04111 [Escherichia coli]